MSKFLFHLNERGVVRDTVDTGIVTGRKSYKQVLVKRKGEAPQNLRELGWPDLRRSTSAAHQVCQPDALIDRLAHSASPPS